MRYNIKNMSIWREDPDRDHEAIGSDMRGISLEDLGLSVRSFNSLKRANCNTVGDIIDVMGEDGDGLRRIRNLGARSEAEIKEKLELLRVEFASRPAARRVYEVLQECSGCKRFDNRYSEATEVMYLAGWGNAEGSEAGKHSGQAATGTADGKRSKQTASGTTDGKRSKQTATGTADGKRSKQTARILSGQAATETTAEILSRQAATETETGTLSEQEYAGIGPRIILRPARALWNREIGEFHLSHYAEDKLRRCGVNKLKDLYATHPKNEPGWYAVRELFRKISEFG